MNVVAVAVLAFALLMAGVALVGLLLAYRANSER
jgi:hypothetical protein